jgi:hypothetical protein
MIATNPNQQVLESRKSSLKQLVGFCKENGLFLNSDSREILSEQFKMLLKNENSINFKALLYSNPSFQLDLINTAKELLPRA